MIGARVGGVGVEGRENGILACADACRVCSIVAVVAVVIVLCVTEAVSWVDELLVARELTTRTRKRL